MQPTPAPFSKQGGEGMYFSSCLARKDDHFASEGMTESTLSSPMLGAAQSQIFLLFPVLLAKD